MAMLERTPESLALQTELADMIRRLPFQDATNLPSEKVPLPQQIAGLRVVDEIYRERLHTIYRPRLQALRAQYRNCKRAFVIGNGPSLKRTDLMALDGEVTFAVDGFLAEFPNLPWRPTFYTVADPHVAEGLADAINALSGSTKLLPVSLAYCINEGPDTIFFDHRPSGSAPHGFDFSLDASEATYRGGTVLDTALQLAHYIGFRELYLIGADVSDTVPADVRQVSELAIGMPDGTSNDPDRSRSDRSVTGSGGHDLGVDAVAQAYREAERTTRKTGRLIYNATVGGNLEVFQRVDYFDLLPQASRANPPEQDDPDRVRALAEHARLLILDMTRIGDGTATGEIEKRLLRRWPKEKLMQIYSAGPGQVALNFSADGTIWSPDPAENAELSARIVAFRPEMILYRPVADRPALHDCAMRLIRDQGPSLALWITDDWMDRLKQSDPALHEAMDADLRGLIDKASALFAISAPMADMLAERYGGTWQVLADAIDPEAWTSQAPEKASDLVKATAAPIPAEPETTDKAILRELKLLRAERFAHWIATGSGRRGISEEAALDAGLAQLQQDVRQIREALVDNERRGALMLKKLTGLVSHVQSNLVSPSTLAVAQDISDLSAAISQLRRELAEVSEGMAENEQRGTLLLRKTALLTEQMTSHPSPRPAPAPARKRSALRSIRRLPARLVRMATGKTGKVPAKTVPGSVGEGGGTPAPDGRSIEPHAVSTSVGSAVFSVRTEWVDLKFDEVGIVLAWTLEGRPTVSTLAVRQQDIIEVRIEGLASANADEAVAPFSLIMPTEGRSGEEILAELSARLVKKREGARNPVSARFLDDLSRQLPDILRTIT